MSSKVREHKIAEECSLIYTFLPRVYWRHWPSFSVVKEPFKGVHGISEKECSRYWNSFLNRALTNWIHTCAFWFRMLGDVIGLLWTTLAAWAPSAVSLVSLRAAELSTRGKKKKSLSKNFSCYSKNYQKTRMPSFFILPSVKVRINLKRGSDKFSYRCLISETYLIELRT